ncbi:alpha-amylase, partial [Pseudomonas aeruginosa]|nr:alpha-amylase [Pseudomonas aeruginosa]
NDNSYGRHKDGMQEIGTFHGGDLQGLTSKLDYLQQMGVNALWISSPLEQIHGWVGGGTKGDFPHYAYHGYYTQDWSKLDANMGTEADLRRLVDEAHKRGIR